MALTKRDKILISILIGIVSSVILYFLLGIPTAVIDNNKFMRMIPKTSLDTFFLLSITPLFGLYAGLAGYIYLRQQKASINYGMTGGVGGLFAISCPTCIYILVAVFGAAFMLKYYDPIRPFIGLISLAIIIFGISKNIQIIKNKCKRCDTAND